MSGPHWQNFLDPHMRNNYIEGIKTDQRVYHVFDNLSIENNPLTVIMKTK